jgi:hypothetical protein
MLVITMIIETADEGDKGDDVGLIERKIVLRMIVVKTMWMKETRMAVVVTVAG